MKQNVTLSCKTKDASAPAGGKRVYCAYHPEDAVYLDAVARVLWETEDCVLYYYDYEANGEPDREQLEALLAEMQLLVVPLTDKLLRTPSNAMTFEIKYAMEHHIPVLPLPGETLLKPKFCAATGMSPQAWEPLLSLYRQEPLDPDRYPPGTPEEDIANGDFCFLTGRFRQAVDYYIHAMIPLYALFQQDEKRYEAQFAAVIWRMHELDQHFHLAE